MWATLWFKSTIMVQINFWLVVFGDMVLIVYAYWVRYDTAHLHKLHESCCWELLAPPCQNSDKPCSLHPTELCKLPDLPQFLVSLFCQFATHANMSVSPVLWLCSLLPFLFPFYSAMKISFALPDPPELLFPPAMVMPNNRFRLKIYLQLTSIKMISWW